MDTWFDRAFGLRARGATPGTELLAGWTTFLAMAYIAVAFLGSSAPPGCRPVPF